MPVVRLLNHVNQNDVRTTKPTFSVARIVIIKLGIMIGGLFICSIFIWSVPLSLDGHQFDGASAAAALFFIFLAGLSVLGFISLLCDLIGVEMFSGPASTLLILFLTTGSAIMDDELSGSIFYMGRAFPFYYAVRGLRFIYFGSLHNKMWINCVVLAAWAIVALTATVFVNARRLYRQRQIISTGDSGRATEMAAHH
ncbi:hypothetical protein BDF19DRAFT_439541 [Syncephalis fuscata]|nr:hypothetical protein BDF19DRAFT_439541 [Syncephalis fuscata]